MKSSNVLYYEPNYVNYISNSKEVNATNAVKLPPQIEDYCVVVDLEVEIPVRPIGGKIETTDGYILLRYSSSMDGNSNLSFNQGKKYTDSKYYYLTTEPYELGTFNDIKRTDGTTTEMFGINSIDIEYNNYTVPVVTIKFTDIRGLSLFANEDLRHNVTSEDGIDYSVNDAISGSFFKCFFTFPYPKFKIIVKGFYGRPVSYELTCSDFRANFDSSTGNFGATAKFVGYTFSVLNDLTMASLLASPYSKYYGKQYWENHADKFVFSDGTKMRPLLDVIKSVDGIIGSLKKYEKDDELDKAQEILNNIMSIKDNHDKYFDTLNTLLKSDKVSYYEKDNFFICANVNESSYVNNNVLNTKYNTLINSINSFNLYSNYDLKAPEKFGINKKKIKELKKIYNLDIKILGIRNDYYFYYDCENLNKKIASLEQKYRELIDEKNNELLSRKNEKIEEAIGFKPSVQNITELLLAHIETFINEIYKCAENVSLTEVVEHRYENETQKKEKVFYAFPNVTKIINSSNKNIRNNERTWIGEYDSNAPESKLVESLLQATNLVSQTVKTTSEKIINSENSRTLSLNVEIPVTPFDYLSNSNPYYNVSLDSNEDIFGKALIRALLIDNSVIFNGDWNTLVKELGKADAINFYKKNTRISDTFRKKVQSVYTMENAIKLLCDYNRTSILSSNIDAIWKTNASKSNALIQNKGLSYQCNFFVNNNKCIIPIGDFNWNDVTNTITNNNKLTNKIEFYTQGYNEENENLFSLISDWQPFNEYIKNTSQDTPNLNSLYGIYFNVNEIVEYYTNIMEKKSMIGNSLLTVGTIEDLDNCNTSYGQLIPLYENSETSSSKNCLTESDDNIIEIKGETNIQLTSISEENLKEILNSSIESERYSLRFLCGYNKNGRISNITSVFGQVEYYYTYANVGKEAAALMVLNTFDWDYSMLIDAFNKNNFNYIPYLFAVTVGGYFYRYDNPNKFKYQKVPNYENDFEGYDAEIDEQLDDKLLSNDLPQTFFNLRTEIKETFKNLFLKWVNESFIKLHDQLSLKLTEDNDYNNDIKKFIVGFVDKFRNNTNNFRMGNNTISFLRKNLQDNFFKNYIMVQCCTDTRNYSLKLIHRDNSEIVKNLFTQLMKSCLMINSIKYPFTDITNNNSYYRLEKVNVNTLKSYLYGFIDGLKKQMPTEKEQESTNETDYKTHEQIRLSYYNYLKIIWDRWLSGNPKVKGNIQWNLSDFKERWHYLDSFYNKLTDKATINIFDFINDISNAFDMIGSSALSIMSTTYARSRFVLMCVQNFSSMIDDELMRDMFKPIPFNQINYGDIKNLPDFIVMYTNEPSSKLDIKNSEYQNDSFLIGGDEQQLPEPILTKTIEGGYKIPAFGVTYGGQYQSYFNNIEVGMEKPQVTDQSLQAQFALAKIGESGSDGLILGQDLFTIYSNQSYTCTVTMMGCAWVQPLMYFQLNNVPMFKGSYLIQKVTHHISSGKMETIFSGTRMSKFSTPFVKNSLFFTPNDQNGNSDLTIDEEEGKEANIYNNCKYKYFSPLSNYDGNGMDSTELNMTVKDYGDKYGGWMIDMSSKENKTMAELFADIAFTEANGLDELSYKLVLTVIFNRYMAVGKNFVKVLYNKEQHEFYKNYDDEKYVNYAKEIFTKTPLILVGKQTYVKPLIINNKIINSPIWNYNQKSSEYVVSKTITEHDVKSMDMYCTSLGYNTNYKNPRNGASDLEAIPPSNKAYWHKGEYLLEHDTEKRFGHVLVATGFGVNNKPGSEHWQPSINNSTLLNNEKPSSLCKSLLNSIKQTIDYSDNIFISNLGIVPYDNLESDTMRIKSNPLSGMSQVFDIILNTYYDHFSELYWVVGNSSNDLPIFLQIKVFNNSKKKIVAIAKEDKTKKNKITVLNEYENLHKDFYLSLQKRYGDLTDTSSLFKTECLNFSSITSKSDWENTVKNLLNNELADCQSSNADLVDMASNNINEINNSRYSWNGSDHKLNKITPTKINGDFNPNDAALFAKENAIGTKTDCAKYVRLAIQHGGLDISNNHPYSACCYAKFLPKWGFKLVYNGFIGKDSTSFIPQNGDVVVIAGISNEGDQKKHGHIQMYCDGFWYSDYKGKTMWCYNDNGRPYNVYRWNNS